MKKFALLLAALAMTVPGVTTAGSDHTFGSNSFPCGDNGTISWTPTTLWPPNHKLHDITFTYTDDDSDGSGDVELAVTATDHSDVVGGEELNGSGNTDPGTDSLGGGGADTDGSVDVVGNARAERSGHSKGGRTYTFDYVAEADMMQDGCDSMEEGAPQITVFVPHDCRGGACKP